MCVCVCLKSSQINVIKRELHTTYGPSGGNCAQAIQKRRATVAELRISRIRARMCVCVCWVSGHIKCYAQTYQGCQEALSC